MAQSNKDINERISSLRQSYAKHGQDHVLEWMDTLNEGEKLSCVEDLEEIELERVNRLYTVAREAEKSVATFNLKPFPKLTRIKDADKAHVEQWEKLGLKAIADNQVAVLLLAGGQGTRLGSKDPKGMYDIGLPSHKSLFQLQAERILRLQTLAAQGSKTQPHISWYIMTSPATDQPTRDYFKSKGFFGLDKTTVQFFVQGTLPCLSPQGKIIMESGHKVSRAPDGNGGVYRAVLTQGVLKDMKARGVKHIHCYGVDNALVKVGDPQFIGFCIDEQAATGVKAVTKAYPTEALGIFCLNNDQPSVVEYSELSDELAHQKDGAGNLVYSAGNIANHYYTLECLERCATDYEAQLSYHIAQKKIKHAGPDGQTVTPDAKNGIKLELFIFDVLPLAESVAVLEVDRIDNFTPVKNAPGSEVDSPDTARRDVLALHTSWVKAKGAVLADKAVVEVSPLRSYNAEQLEGVSGNEYANGAIIKGEEEV